MNKDAFDIIILVGRPASGKSEIIDYLRNTQANARRRLFHIGELGFIDDFPMLWTWFEEDHILEHTLGRPRLHTDADGNFKHEYLWHLLIERIGLEHQKLLRDQPDYYDRHTTIVEFARGTSTAATRPPSPISARRSWRGRRCCTSTSPSRSRCARTANASTRTGPTAFWSMRCPTKSCATSTAAMTSWRSPPTIRPSSPSTTSACPTPSSRTRTT
ncbi:MAG: hypothetical protein R2851_10055 [Caldilineaceae bacterium]